MPVSAGAGECGAGEEGAGERGADERGAAVGRQVERGQPANAAHARIRTAGVGVGGYWASWLGVGKGASAGKGVAGSRVRAWNAH